MVHFLPLTCSLAYRHTLTKNGGRGVDRAGLAPVAVVATG